MAFTFQINTDVEFIHDEYLLKKAEENRPEIRTEEITPVRIAEIVPDSTRLNGTAAKQVKRISHSCPPTDGNGMTG